MGLFSKKEKKEPEEIHEEKLDTTWIPNSFVIPDSEIPEKYIPEFMTNVEKFREMILSQELYKPMPIFYHDKQLGIYNYFDANYHIPWKITPPKELVPHGAQEEQTLWFRVNHEGAFNKKIKDFQVVTNYRTYYYNMEEYKVINYRAGHEIIVNNQKRISQSQRTGGFSGSRSGGMFAGTSSGFSTGQSETIGDVVIMIDGTIEWTIPSVSDPHGLEKLLKHVIKSTTQLLSDSRAWGVKQTRGVNCGKCGTANPNDSKFCNKCGNKLNSACIKCGKINEEGSSFCNSCGFALQ